MTAEFAKANLGDALIVQAVPNKMQFAPRELHVKAGATAVGLSDPQIR